MELTQPPLAGNVAAPEDGRTPARLRKGVETCQRFRAGQPCCARGRAHSGPRAQGGWNLPTIPRRPTLLRPRTGALRAHGPGRSNSRPRRLDGIDPASPAGQLCCARGRAHPGPRAQGGWNLPTMPCRPTVLRPGTGALRPACVRGLELTNDALSANGAAPEDGRTPARVRKGVGTYQRCPAGQRCCARGRAHSGAARPGSKSVVMSFLIKRAVVQVGIGAVSTEHALQNF